MDNAHCIRCGQHYTLTTNQGVVGSACADMLRRLAEIGAREGVRPAAGWRRAHHGRRAAAAVGEGGVRA